MKILVSENEKSRVRASGLSPVGDSKVQSVFTHVASSQANLLEQKEVFT